MDSNRDEAQRALKLAKNYQNSDPQKALKFARKACALYWSPESAALVRSLEKGEGPSNNNNNNQENEKPSGSSTSTKKGGSSTESENLRSRTSTSNSSSTPKPSTTTNNNINSNQPNGNFKPAQLEIVQKVKRCKITQYYEILQLARDCDEGQIKSAYRKLALALHPDKNNAPGADEAFKMVSKAFQVLSDPEKRAAFDRHGADPDSRSAGFPSSSSFGGHGHTHFTHDDVIDPDQLFKMFFGGGFEGPGVQFGAGPTIFQFGNGRTTFRRGGPGMWTQNQRGQRNRQGNEEVPEPRTPTAWMSFLPIIIFFGISLIQSFSSIFSAPTIPDPTISWNQNSLYSIQRVTHSPSSVKYFVNPAGFATHPMYEAYLKANPSLGFQPASTPNAESSSSSSSSDKKSSSVSSFQKNELIKILPKESKELVEKRSVDRQRMKLPKQFKKFEESIESSWVRKLQSECYHYKEIKENQKRNLMGFMGIGANWEEIRKLDSEKIPSCEELSLLGYIVN